MSGGLYTITTRVDGEVLTAAKYNADHQSHIDHLIPTYIDDYSASTTEMKTQTSPGLVGSESLSTALSGELERLRYVMADTKGTTYWYSAPNVINVKSPRYGAVGDGVTNDTSAILAALAAATAGSTIYFPPGTYIVNSSLYF